MNYEEMEEAELWDLSHDENLDVRSDVLIELGQRNIQSESFNLAKNLFGSAATLCEELGKEHELTRAIYSVGYCHYRLSEYDEAIQQLEISLKRSQEIGHSRSVAFSAGPLGDSYSQLGQDDEAIANYEIAVDAFVEIEDQYNAGINCLAMGELNGKNARQTRALECFIRAYNIFQSGGDAFGAARARDRMAAALIELGDLEQAAGHIVDALHTFEHMEIEEQVAYMKYRHGKVLVLSGHYFKAIQPLRQAIIYYRGQNNWSSAARAEVELAQALVALDPETENDEATQFLERTHAYFEAAGEVSYALVVETIQADRLVQKGKLEPAVEMFRDVVKRALELGDDELVRTSRTSLAELLFKLGRVSEAKEALDQVDAAAWGENRLELNRLEKVKELMMETLAMQLNIKVPA